MAETSGRRVVIVGGGFAGLRAARAMRGAAVEVTLIDQKNHHTFQPLLYQVATAALSPAQIAAPIRRIVAGQANCRVLLAEVTGIDPVGKRVVLTDGEVGYDWLVLAAGVRHSYFGHEEWAVDAPGLKALEDATEIRRRFLLAFERAERESDPVRRRAALTFVVIGGGPTGVEMAGAMAEIARTVISTEFRSIRQERARVMLIEAGDRVLGSFEPKLSAHAKQDLEEMGVQVMTSSRVIAVDSQGVVVQTTAAAGVTAAPAPLRVDAGCVMWAAGVRASPIVESLKPHGVELDRAGRVVVNEDLSVKGFPTVFVCGDLASVKQVQGDGAGKPVPGVAPAAMQMGTFVGRLIRREIERGPGVREKFVYVNKGELATIGKNKAVGVLGFGLHVPLTGFIAWALWALVHVSYLIGFRNRLLVMIDWMWSYIFFERGARLITGQEGLGPLAQASKGD